MRRFATPEIQDFETQHIDVVRTLAPECTVLLKNEGILPLAGTGKIAVYGSGARRTIKGGTGSGDVNVRHFVTVEEGLRNAGFEITTDAWLDGYEEVMNNARKEWGEGIKQFAKASGINPIFAAMGKAMPEPDYELPLDGEGDTAVYVLSRISGEGNDRQAVAGDIDLTKTEIRDILALNEKYEKFVLVLNVGGMVNLAPVENVKAILLLGQLGTPTGDVCADLLLGKSYPSGKLTMTWAPIDQYPSTEGFGDINDTRYQEGVYVGYRYFESFGKTPTHPFGYGLGYTTFDVAAGDVEADADKVYVHALVTNTGNARGKEVVQVYVSAPKGKLDKPYQELKAFAKTGELAPGASEEVELVLNTASMASFCENTGAYILEKGDYIIRVGNCSDKTVMAAVITLDADVVTEKVKSICPGWDFADMRPEGDTTRKATYDKKLSDDIKRITLNASSFVEVTHTYREDPIEIPAGDTIPWNEVRAGNRSVDDFVAGLGEEQLAKICVGNYAENVDGMSVIGQACSAVAGGAGETTGHLSDLGLETLSMADGPAGIRVNTEYKIVGGNVKGQGSALAGMLDFLDEEAMAQMAAMMPKPTQEELDAPLYYQYCIAIPIGTALAQSFNTSLCEQLGDIVGEEMETFGVTLWLAPALNIQRSPLCGRNFEYYSEDPVVSGKIAAAITDGVQKHEGCATTIKHFAANNQESNRYGSNSIVSERALREIYLKGFEIAVKESRPKSLMTSYNLINGEHSCNSKDLNTYVLRDEWGYDGFVMTDWLVTRDVMINPAGAHGKASAAGCVKAGNDLTMPGDAEDTSDILSALKDVQHPYHLTKAELQAAAKTVLTSILELSR